jgi:SAM-dependent methyltransferase
VIETARIISLLKQWRSVGQPTSRLFLDLRNPTAYKRQRIVPSTNIPLVDLEKRCSELPAKQTPFAVMEPLDAKGATQWLFDRGWNCPWVFWEGDFDQNVELWTDLASLQLAESTPNEQSWLMFNPAPILEESIASIEQSLKSRTNNSELQKRLSCLDIGCGSGRDLAWLLSRKAVDGSPIWRATAVDSSHGATNRTSTICENMGLSDQLDGAVNAKVAANGLWRLLKRDDPNKQVNTTVKKGGKPIAAIGDDTIDFFSKTVQQQINNTIPPKHDLIITIRFLVRPILPYLPNLLNPGGYIIISHFVDHEEYEYDQPRQDHRLEVDELRNLFGSMNGMSIVVDKIEQIEDGRPVNSIIIRKENSL